MFILSSSSYSCHPAQGLGLSQAICLPAVKLWGGKSNTREAAVEPRERHATLGTGANEN